MTQSRSTLTWVPFLVLAAGSLAAADGDYRFKPSPYKAAEPSETSPFYTFSKKAEKTYADKHRFDKPRPAISAKWKEMEIKHLTKKAFLEFFQNDDVLNQPNGAWIDKIRGGAAFNDLGISQKQLFGALRTFDRLVAAEGTLGEIYQRWLKDYELRNAALAMRKEKSFSDWFEGLENVSDDDPQKIAWQKENRWQDEEQAVLSRLKKALNEIYNQEQRLQSQARQATRRAEKEKANAERKLAREKRDRDRLEAKKRKEEERARKKAERERARSGGAAAKPKAEPAPVAAKPIRKAPAPVAAAKPTWKEPAPAETFEDLMPTAEEAEAFDFPDEAMDEAMSEPVEEGSFGILGAFSAILSLSGLGVFAIVGVLSWIRSRLS